MYMRFFKLITGNIVKWWRLTILPVLRINNDRTDEGRFTQVGDDNSNSDVSGNPDKNVSKAQTGQATVDKKTTEAMEEVVETNTASKAVSSEDGDAQEILNRINREKEEKQRQEVLRAQRDRDEKARIASIMSANKVDVNAFIQAGKAAVEEQKDEDAEAARKEEELRRAQEIMERLNREAAEDEAKKQAEIEAARQMAQEKFNQ